MKEKLLFILLILFVLVGCSKDEVNEKEILELTLDQQVVRLDNIETAKDIFILSGNGDYKIIYPKKIDINDQPVDYSENYLKASIRNNYQIVVERTSSIEDTIKGHLLLVDKEGKKRIIIVKGNEKVVGDLVDIKDIEECIGEDQNYWQK